MTAFFMGMLFGSAATYFFVRFKDALAVFKKKTEKKIEESLRGD